MEIPGDKLFFKLRSQRLREHLQEINGNSMKDENKNLQMGAKFQLSNFLTFLAMLVCRNEVEWFGALQNEVYVSKALQEVKGMKESSVLLKLSLR